MIHATDKGLKLIEVRSDKNGRTAKVWDWTSTWQIEYSHNGARKNLPTYAEVLTHLEAQGW